MPKQLTLRRTVSRETERELWGRAAGRCEFSDCNRPLYKSPVTQEQVNLAEKAHIYAFSAAGPRGRGPLQATTKTVNAISNLMLVCHDCHLKIDRDKTGQRYSAALLREWKEAHERRIAIVTGISPSKKSHVVFYGSRIGDETSPLQPGSAMNAMFPHSYPADERPVQLSMHAEHDDSSPAFWTAEAEHLRKAFERQVKVRIEEANPNHFSVFALASQPLLMLLGSLFTDKVPVHVYQLHREPKTWQWQSHPDSFEFTLTEPAAKTDTPVLLLSLSAKIGRERVAPLVADASIWELTCSNSNNDFLKSEAQLAMFCQAARNALAAIKAAHPHAKEIKVFPAMPVACAVEFGRARQPKADLPWRIYDQNHKHQKFIETLTIGDIK